MSDQIYKKYRLIDICDKVALDMENDAKDFDGKPFNGTTVATYFGNQVLQLQLWQQL